MPRRRTRTLTAPPRVAPPTFHEGEGMFQARPFADTRVPRKSVQSAAVSVQAAYDTALRFGHSLTHLQPQQPIPVAEGFVAPRKKRQRQDGVTVPVQAKLTIGEPNDEYEQEAASVAKQVVERLKETPQLPQTRDGESQGDAAHRNDRKGNAEGSGPEAQEPIRRKEANVETRKAIPRGQATGVEEPDAETSPRIQEAVPGANAAAATEALEGAVEKERGRGKPVDEPLRKAMEKEFGADFSTVQVHTDETSEKMNRALLAQAFTTGQDIFFRHGAYQPNSTGGRELLAHELTHVVQQNPDARASHERTNEEEGERRAAKERVRANTHPENQGAKPEGRASGHEGVIQRQTDLSDLPADVLEHILATAGRTEIGRVAQVSKQLSANVKYIRENRGKAINDDKKNGVSEGDRRVKPWYARMLGLIEVPGAEVMMEEALPTVKEALDMVHARELKEGQTWRKVLGVLTNKVSRLDDKEYLKALEGLMEAMHHGLKWGNHASGVPMGRTGKDAMQRQTKVSPVVIRERRAYKEADQQIMQRLRWISVAIYNWLDSKYKKGEEPVEVQALWDGQVLYVSSNKPKANEKLTREGIGKAVKGGNKAKRKDADPFRRLPAKLAEELGEEGEEMHAVVKALHSFISGKGGVEVVVGEDERHTEVRLVRAAIDKVISADKEGEPQKRPVLYVTGVRRPCYACYVRLKVLSEEYKREGGILRSNDHKGLMWVSASAWVGATEEDKLEGIRETGIMEFIADLETAATGIEEGTAFKSHYEKRPFNLTAKGLDAKGERKGVGEYNTESDESEEESEGDQESEEEGEEEHEGRPSARQTTEVKGVAGGKRDRTGEKDDASRKRRNIKNDESGDESKDDR